MVKTLTNLLKIMNESLKQKETLDAEIKELESAIESLECQLEVKKVRLERKLETLRILLNNLNNDYE